MLLSTEKEEFFPRESSIFLEGLALFFHLKSKFIKKMANILNRFHSNYNSFIDTPISDKMSSRYVEVPHRQVIETIGGYLDQKNIQINKEHYLTDSTGLKAMGVLDIGHIDADMAYQIAWRNSLDGTLAFQIVSGSQVRVCSNTNMWGEFSNKQKHWGGNASSDIIMYLKQAIDQFDDVVKLHLENKEILMNEKVDLTTAAQLAGQMFIQEDIITATQLSIIKREILTPTFDYQAEGTMYEFHNHCTYALKEAHPTNWISSHKNVCEYLLNKVVEERSPIVNIPYSVIDEPVTSEGILTFN